MSQPARKEMEGFLSLVLGKGSAQRVHCGLNLFPKDIKVAFLSVAREFRLLCKVASVILHYSKKMGMNNLWKKKCWSQFIGLTV